MSITAESAHGLPDKRSGPVPVSEITGPPRESFISDEWYKRDIDKVFRPAWILAAHTTELSTPGSFLTVSLDQEELIVVRDKQGNVNAFHNFCRHRGHRLCTSERGQLKGNIFCQYHGWAYSTQDGSCVRSIRMHEGFDKSQWGLVPAWCEEIDGLIFVSFSKEKPRSLRPSLTEVGYGGYDLRRLKLIERRTYPVNANWKVVLENNLECYHCTLNHPELITNWDPWRDRANDISVVSSNGDVVLRGMGPVTNTINGETVCKLPVNRTEGGPADSFMVTWRPGNEIHFARDYVWIFTLKPAGPRVTIKTDFYLVHEDAREGVDYSVDEVVKCISLTMAQDSTLCEEVQRGYDMTRYTPGPLNQLYQRGQIAFYSWYEARLAAE